MNNNEALISSTLRMEFKFFKNRSSNYHSLQRQTMSVWHAGWPDISAKVDLCVANWYSLAIEITDFGHI